MITTVILLLYGAGAVFLASAFESNPDGSNVGIVQTIQDVWNDNLHFNTTPPNSTSPTALPAGTQPSGISPLQTLPASTTPSGISPLTQQTKAVEQIQQSSL